MREVRVDWESIRAMQPGTATRRLVWPGPGMNVLTVNNWPKNDGRHAILNWVEKYTTGQFYLGGNKIAFMDEKDELIFRLGFKDE